MSGDNLKKRRGPVNVTQNACTECRKKRSKCDGQKPCRRCITYGAQCDYVIPVRQSKKQLRNELVQLRLKEKQQDRLITALLSKDYSESQLEKLRNGVAVTKASENSENLILDPEILRDDSQRCQTDIVPNKLSVGENTSLLTTSLIDESINEPQISIQDHSKSINSQPYIKDSKFKLSPHDNHSNSSIDLSKEYENFRNKDITKSTNYASVGQYAKYSSEVQDLNKITDWTALDSDEAWINHLIMLYFTWEYPIFAPLSKDDFMKDFKNGKRRYCSSLLVNSILAAACRFSSQPRARLIATDPKTAGDQYFTEAVRILQSDQDFFSLTKIQALNILSIREAGCGHSSASIFFSGKSVRLAIEMGLHKDLNITIRKNSDLKKQTVRLATFWGTFSLDQAWSLCSGRLPQFSKNIKFIKKPKMVKDRGLPPWSPDNQDGPKKSDFVSSQSLNDWNVFVIFCDLSEIVHRSLHILYSPAEKVTSFKLLACYTEYLHWYDSNPTTMRLGQVFTPAILFSHILYHLTILLLFRSLINYDIINSTVSPREVCLEASEAISTLVNSYNRLYTLHHAPALLPYIVLISSITKLMIYRNSGVDIHTFKQGISDLQMMTSSNATAFFGLDILRYLIEHGGELEGFDFREKKSEQNIEIQENLLCEKVILGTVDNFDSATLNIHSHQNLQLDDAIGIIPEYIGNEFLPLPLSLQKKPIIDARNKDLAESGFRFHRTSGLGFAEME